jgi:uncharacterized protein YecE (DUF72 family)
MENWQSEYLQFTLYILGTVWLLQKGSPESKIFLGSWFAHSVTGWSVFNSAARRSPSLSEQRTTRLVSRADKQVWVGCSGWNYRDWRETFYPKGLPAKRWLEHYATLFRTVEVNNTFYRLPNVTAVEGWAEQTPDDFVFTVKASRYLTHIKRLTDMSAGVERFYERIEPLISAGKLGPVLWQLPGNFHRDDDRLASAIERLPAGWHCFEFRHESWFTEEVYELLRARNIALVIGDHPDRPFQTCELTADWTFIRFHHGHCGRNGNYSKAELETWKRRIESLTTSVDVFAYFNNDWNAYAVKNARFLQAKASAVAA